MAFYKFSPTTGIVSAETNSNFSNIANGSEVATTAWTTYIPTWTGTVSNPAIGNGLITAKYIALGKIITVCLTMVMGTTTTYGSGGWLFSLPVNSVTTNPISIGSCRIADASAGIYYTGVASYNSGTDFTAFTHNTSGNVGQTIPITFATSDTFIVQFTYEAA